MQGDLMKFSERSLRGSASRINDDEHVLEMAAAHSLPGPEQSERAKDRLEGQEEPRLPESKLEQFCIRMFGPKPRWEERRRPVTAIADMGASDSNQGLSQAS